MPAGFVFNVEQRGDGRRASRADYARDELTPSQQAFLDQEIATKHANEERQFYADKRREELENLNLKRARSQADGDSATEIAFAKIHALREDNARDFEKEYENLIVDPDIHRAMLGSGREDLKSFLAMKMKNHEDYIKRWQGMYEQHGGKGDVRDVLSSYTEDGSFHPIKAKKLFNQTLSNARRETAAQQEAAREAGYTMLTYTDPETGKKVNKFEKLNTDEMFNKKPTEAQPKPQPASTASRPSAMMNQPSPSPQEEETTSSLSQPEASGTTGPDWSKYYQ